MKRVRFAVVVALSVLGGRALATDPAPDEGWSEASFLEGMQLGMNAKPSYIDASGQSITFEEFYALLKRGERFGLEKREKEGVVVFTIGGRVVDPNDLPGNRPLDSDTPLPAWSLPAVSGAAFEGPAGLVAPTLISFFFADCLPCIEDVPTLNAFSQLETGLNLAAVTYESGVEAETFVAEHGLRWPTYHSGQSFIDSVGVRVYPSFAIVDADGRVLGVGTKPGVFGTDDQSVGALNAWVAETLR